MTSDAFDRDVGGARKTADEGPVFIIENVQPTYVLLSFDEYRKLGGVGPTIVDLLAMPDAAEIDFEPPRAFLGALG